MKTGLIKKHNDKALQNANNDRFWNFLSPLFDMDDENSWLQNAYNLNETDDKYELKVQLPGVKKEEIDLSFKDDTLTVSWNHKSKNESSSGSESFYLAGASLDDIKASLEDGILTVELLKTADTKSKKITIN